MAEAIMFAHRSIAPIIDLQEQLRETGRQAQAPAVIEPATDSVLDFAERSKAGGEFVVFDVETTGTRPEDGRPRRDRRGQGQGRQDHRPLVHLRQSGPAIVGNQMHGITDADVKRRPDPGRGRPQAPRLAPATPRWSATTSASTSGSSRPQWPTAPKSSQGRYLDTLVLTARPTRTSTNSSWRPGQVLRARARAEPSRAAGRRGHGGTADCARQGPARRASRPSSTGDRRRDTSDAAPRRQRRPRRSGAPQGRFARACRLVHKKVVRELGAR